MNPTVDAYLQSIEYLMNMADEDLDGLTIELCHMDIDGYEADLKGYTLDGEEFERFDATVFELELFQMDLDLRARPNIRYINKDLGDASKGLETVIRRMKRFQGVPGVKYRRRIR